MARISLLGATLLLALAAAAQQAGDLQEQSKRLAVSILLGPSMETLRELSDGFGGRVTGSPAYQRAAEWAAAQFRARGLQNVRLEPFAIPNGWQRGWASGQVLGPSPRPLHIESLAWAPSTPPAGVKGEVVLVDDVSAEKIKALAAQIQGRVVLLDTDKILAEGPRKWLLHLLASYQLFKEAGALALLFPDAVPNNVLGDFTDPLWGAKVLPLPMAEIGLEDGKLIRRLLEHGPVSLEFRCENRVTGPVEVSNVVAEIAGSASPEDWILVGAHLDSWDPGSGAQDNGTGSVMVLEAARAVAALGQAPRRSIRFALWGGEEQGYLGSMAYVQAHVAELGRCVAVLNTDNGAGHPRGWKVEGRKDLSEAMEPISRSLLRELSGGELSQELTFDTDHGPFMLQGIPVLDLLVDAPHYEEIHHKSGDTFDKVDPLDFKAGAAIVAVTAYALAQNPQPIAPHLDHAAVAEILKKLPDLDTLLTYVGLWKP